MSSEYIDVTTKFCDPVILYRTVSFVWTDMMCMNEWFDDNRTNVMDCNHATTLFIEILTASFYDIRHTGINFRPRCQTRPLKLTL